MTELDNRVRSLIPAGRVLWQRTQQGFLLYDVTTDMTFEGNAVGAEIVALLDGSRCCADVAQELAARYHRPQDTLLEDVKEFLHVLHRHSLVELR